MSAHITDDGARITVRDGRRVHPLSTVMCVCGRRVLSLALDTTHRCARCAPADSLPYAPVSADRAVRL